MCNKCNSAKVTPQPDYEMITSLMAYETGELEAREEAELFQRLIDDGIVWNLQGHYGRHAAALITAGVCHNRAA